MNMKRITFMLLLTLVFCAFAQPAIAAKKVAVYVEGEISQDDKAIISSSVLARLSNTKDYTAYERNEAFINSLNKEQDFQLSGEVLEKEIRKVGERIGVDNVIVVNVIISGKNCHMSARMLDLVSGEILKSVDLQRKYTDSDVIKNMTNNIAYRLINKRSK